MYLKSYKSYNEGLLNGVSSKFGNLFKSLKPINRFTNANNRKLSSWNISSKKVSDTYYQLLHSNRIIGEVRVTDEGNKPVFKLSIYFYNTEIENINNISLDKKFTGQKEQPYGKASRKFYTVESALDFLISFWSTKTKSGKSKNPDFKINL